MSEPLWRPDQDRIDGANVTAFRQAVNEMWATGFADTAELWAFSVAEPEKFWVSVRDFAGLIAAEWGDRVIVDGDKMPGAKWFPDARINFAENLLRRRDAAEALIFWGEDKVRRRMSFAELHDEVSRFAQALAAEGVGPGDRVGAYVANLPEAVVAMLATVSLGATWSSCSPDFGVQGVLDRFGQIEPKVLVVCDGYFYNGQALDIRPKAAEIVAGLPSVKRTVMVPYIEEAPDTGDIRDAVSWSDCLSAFSAGEIDYAAMPFDHPLYILYSSGTTGKPKCIVHGAGGMLLKHATEQVLHCDVKHGDRVFWFTTLGWMMWNWLVSNLAWGATIVLYDGSPFHPSANVIFDLAQDEAISHFGTSAKFIDACKKAELAPIASHAFPAMRMLGSTGSTLAPEAFDYVYEKIKTDVHLASVAGGTDIAGCFCAGDPTLPVWRGEIQAAVLGMAVDTFDDNGQPLRGDKGELVCTRSFPTVPLGFLGDDDGSRFHDAYFDAFAGVWTHGDYVEITDHGGFIFHGRSDATLNPGGVRIGTAEIYRQVEILDEVTEAIVIGQDWDNDVRVVLFVILKGGVTLDDALSQRIRAHIRANCSPRHVPAKVIQVADIPRTKSGKITELAVRDVVHGRPVKNKEALANPEALELYRALPQLSE